MQKLRTSLAYLNARRYGLSKSQAFACAMSWRQHSTTLYSQSVADQVFNASVVNTINFTDTTDSKVLYVSAHFSAYTLVTMVLARHYKKTIYIVVGTPPVEFENAIVESLAKVGAKAIIIRSDFSLLKNIRSAIDEGALVFSLFDVPWTRLEIPNRDLQEFSFGEGNIQAIDAIFSIAKRLKLRPTLVLCEPSDGTFNIVNYGERTQQECFEKLALAVKANPGHFERFCELHKYYVNGVV